MIDTCAVRRWLPRLVVIGVTAVGAILAVRAIREAQESARRSQSKNNLRQIGLAMHNYRDVYSVLPAADLRYLDGQTRLSWMASLLPQIDSSPLFSMIGQDLPWNHPRNAPIYRTQLAVFQIPGAGERADAEGFALSHYAANSQLFKPNEFARRPDQSAVLAGEVAADYGPWGAPDNVRDGSLLPNSGPNAFGRPTRDGAFLLIGDGSVRFVASAVDATALPVSGRQETRQHRPYSEDFQQLTPNTRAMVQRDTSGNVAAMWAPWAHRFEGEKMIVNADDIAMIARMPRLELAVLDVVPTAPLERLADLSNLKALLVGAHLTDDDLRRLEGLKSLKYLELWGLNRDVTPEGLARLRAALPECDVRVNPWGTTLGTWK